MKLAIMQPYFLPYIGYFQLIKAVDLFVLYDNIQYTKKGWINRNRYLLNGESEMFTLPLKKDSDYKNVNERFLANSDDLKKMERKLLSAYRSARHYADAEETMCSILRISETNLFSFLEKSIYKVCEALEIKTPFLISSSLEIDHSLKGKEKVITICKYLNADCYLNPIGGINLYSKDEFKSRGISLSFLRSEIEPYEQSGPEFIPNLSILDLMMHEGLSTTKAKLSEYELL